MSLPFLFKKISRKVLRSVFQFDVWHTYILEDRQYALDIIDFCNKRTIKNSAIEIGCGLGDIIRKLDYSEKWGFDKEYNVIRAAKFLSIFNKSKNTHFDVFNFPDSELELCADVIIMVNWPFLFDTELLHQQLKKYFLRNLTPGGQIILDTLQDTFYPNNHDIKLLTKEINAKIVKIGNYARQREVWAIEKLSIVA